MDVSIVIPVLNGLSDHLAETLAAIRTQRTGSGVEIIVIDSGSTDGTVEYLRQDVGVRLFQIPPKEFGHGKTRQYGATLASGDIVVFLVQDATPADDVWLERLIAGFSDEQVVGVCGRVVPREDAFVLKKINVDNDLSARTEPITAFVTDPVAFARMSFAERRGEFYFFNDISSAVRRSYILETPFPDVPFAEDVEFAVAALDRGKKILYEPDSIVYHSHAYTIGKTYMRNVIDSEYHLTRLNVSTVPTIRHLWRNTWMTVRRDYSSLRRYRVSPLERLSAVLYSPIIHFSEQLGQYVGSKRKC